MGESKSVYEILEVPTANLFTLPQPRLCWGTVPRLFRPC